MMSALVHAIAGAAHMFVETKVKILLARRTCDRGAASTPIGLRISLHITSGCRRWQHPFSTPTGLLVSTHMLCHQLAVTDRLCRPSSAQSPAMELGNLDLVHTRSLTVNTTTPLVVVCSATPPNSQPTALRHSADYRLAAANC